MPVCPTGCHAPIQMIVSAGKSGVCCVPCDRNSFRIDLGFGFCVPCCKSQVIQVSVVSIAIRRQFQQRFNFFLVSIVTVYSYRRLFKSLLCPLFEYVVIEPIQISLVVSVAIGGIYRRRFRSLVLCPLSKCRKQCRSLVLRPLSKYIAVVSNSGHWCCVPCQSIELS